MGRVSARNDLSRIRLFGLLCGDSFGGIYGFTYFCIQGGRISRSVAVSTFLRLLRAVGIRSISGPVTLLVAVIGRGSLSCLGARMQQRGAGSSLVR